MSHKKTTLFDDGQIQIKREDWAEHTFGGETIPAHTDYRVGVQNYFMPTMTLDELAKLRDAVSAVLEVERLPKPRPEVLAKFAALPESEAVR